MILEIAESDVIILSIAAACLVAAILLEVLRVVLPDIYEWVADHARIRVEIADTRKLVARTVEKNRQQSALRDRKGAERFRLKSQLSRTDMTLAGLERDRVEVWHELGEPAVGDSLFVARVAHRLLADRSMKDFDSAPDIWRYANTVRIRAATERAARARLHATFPAADGFSTGEVTPVQGPAGKPPEGRAPAGMPTRERAGTGR